MNNRILIVDDEESSRDALARLLAAKGYDVETVGDSQQAVRAMGDRPAATVLLDIGLPFMPGDCFATFLNIRHPKTRIIFISGQYDMIDPERFGGDTLFFRKPLDIDALLGALASVRPAASPV